MTSARLTLNLSLNPPESFLVTVRAHSSYRSSLTPGCRVHVIFPCDKTLLRTVVVGVQFSQVVTKTISVLDRDALIGRRRCRLSALASCMPGPSPVAGPGSTAK